MRLLLSFVMFAMITPALTAQGTAKFVPLFNGKDLDGWEVRNARPTDKEKWFIKDGVLTAEPGSGWIGTKKMYGDFTLKVEWRIQKHGNSGVFLRVPEVKSKESPSYLGMEIDSRRQLGEVRQTQVVPVLRRPVSLPGPEQKNVQGRRRMERLRNHL